MKVAVVILNWNGRAYLARFLPSVLEHSAGIAEVVVADNASTDGSIEWLADAFPATRVLRFSENGGFSKGYNDALAMIDADYYVLLNSDVEVTAGWLAPMLEMMEEHPRVGACQPKVLCHHDKTRFEYAGAAGGFIDAYGYPFCRGRIFDELEEDAGQYDDEREIFWATGACLFVRAELYHQLGGLDEDFFAHMEEIDFCWRMKNAGFKLMVCPSSKVYHVGGGALPKSSPRKTYLNFRNNLSLLVKNMPTARLFPVLVARYFLDALAAAVFFMKGQRADAGAVWAAHAHFLRSLPRLMKKRKVLQQGAVSPVYGGNLVYERFVNKVAAFSQLSQEKWR